MKQQILKSFSLVRKHTVLSTIQKARPVQCRASCVSSKFLVAISLASLPLASFWWSELFLLMWLFQGQFGPKRCTQCCLWHTGTKFRPRLNSALLSKTIFRPHEVSCLFYFFSFFSFFLQVVSGFGGPQKMVCRKEFGRCETSLCFFRSVSHCCLHGSDTLFVWQCT